MNIGTTGIIIDQKMQLLVIKRDDTRTWAPPGGASDAGEMPTESVTREVEEETGFKIMPVRLVGLSFIPEFGEGVLQFTFRCLLRGGEARTSRESLDIGFIATNPIKTPMLDITKTRVELALVHQGNTPHWRRVSLTRRERLAYQLLTKAFYPVKNWVGRTFQNRHYTPPPAWHVSVNLVVKHPDNAVYWLQKGEQFQLPATDVAAGEAPWEAAERLGRTLFGHDVTLTHLNGVYNIGDSQHMVLLFSAETPAPPQNPQLTALANPPQQADPLEQARVADALDPLNELTVFKRQSAES